jgi:hypothetical protein
VEGDQNRDRLVREQDIFRSLQRNAIRMRPPREELAYEDEELEEQHLPLVVRGDDGHPKGERRWHLEDRLIIHNRAIGDINTITRGFVGGGKSSSARRNHARSLSSWEVFSTTRLAMLQKRETQPIGFSNDDFHGLCSPMTMLLW